MNIIGQTENIWLYDSPSNKKSLILVYYWEQAKKRILKVKKKNM